MDLGLADGVLAKGSLLNQLRSLLLFFKSRRSRPLHGLAGRLRGEWFSLVFSIGLSLLCFFGVSGLLVRLQEAWLGALDVFFLHDFSDGLSHGLLLFVVGGRCCNLRAIVLIVVRVTVVKLEFSLGILGT